VGRRSSRFCILAAAAAVAAVLAVQACVDGSTVLARLIEARDVASGLHVEFTKASDASNRAVMSESDEAAAAAVEESKRARQLVERNSERLQTILASLKFDQELRYLEEFKARFDEYGRLDDEVLSLATENSNIKAQRLSFGPSRDALDAMRASLDAAVGEGAGGPRAEALAARAQNAVLDIQVLHAPHIAEADDGAMTRLEERMAKDESVARDALEQLEAAVGPSGAAQVAAARAALDRFTAVHKQIITLSRRNSNVRSLALSLGRKRTLAAQCEDQLTQLEQALSKHRFTATR
jgi:hypothetical protein